MPTCDTINNMFFMKIIIKRKVFEVEIIHATLGMKYTTAVETSGSSPKSQIRPKISQLGLTSTIFMCASDVCSTAV